MTEFVNEPIDEEERALMDAIENGETHPIPRDELAKIRREIAACSRRSSRSWSRTSRPFPRTRACVRS